MSEKVNPTVSEQLNNEKACKLSDAVNTAMKNYKTAEAGVDKADAAVEKASAALETAREKAVKASDKVEASVAKVGACEQKVADNNESVNALKSDLAALKDEPKKAEKVAAKLETAQSKAKKMQTDIATAKKAVKTAEAAAEKAKKAIPAAEKKVPAAELALTKAEAKEQTSFDKLCKAVLAKFNYIEKVYKGSVSNRKKAEKAEKANEALLANGDTMISEAKAKDDAAKADLAKANEAVAAVADKAKAKDAEVKALAGSSEQPKAQEELKQLNDSASKLKDAQAKAKKNADEAAAEAGKIKADVANAGSEVKPLKKDTEDKAREEKIAEVAFKEITDLMNELDITKEKKARKRRNPTPPVKKEATIPKNELAEEIAAVLAEADKVKINKVEDIMDKEKKVAEEAVKEKAAPAAKTEKAEEPKQAKPEAAKAPEAKKEAPKPAPAPAAKDAKKPAPAQKSDSPDRYRLKRIYKEQAIPALLKQFNYKNVNEVPRLVKVSLNMGLGDVKDDAKKFNLAVDELKTICGQKPVVTRAKKSVANFKVREGMNIGAKVTLRGDRMYEFLDKFISVALPRVRDFKGVPSDSFDGRGNYAMGIKEQLIFPEIRYDQIDKIRGFDIIIVTTAKSDEEAKGLLTQIGLPFKA